MRNALVLRLLLVLGLGVSAGIGGVTPAAQAASRSTDHAVVSIFGEAGDPVTTGTHHAWRTGPDAVTVTRSDDGVRVVARTPGQESFEFVLLSAQGEQFTYGGFFDATATPTAGRPTVNVTGGGRTCDGGSTGRFRVLDNSADLTRLWILFEQRCTGAPGSSFGEIRVNADQDRAVLVAPARLEFPEQGAGTAGVTVPVTLFNIGSEPVTFGTPRVVGRPTKTPFSPVGDDPIGAAGSASFFIDDTTCGTVAPGASCVILVSYRPLLPGPVEAALVVPDSTSLGSHQMSLTASAI